MHPVNPIRFSNADFRAHRLNGCPFQTGQGSQKTQHPQKGVAAFNIGNSVCLGGRRIGAMDMIQEGRSDSSKMAGVQQLSNMTEIFFF